MPNVSQITHEGVTLSLKEWAARKKLRPSTIHARINVLKWDVARALDTPATKKFARGGRGGRKPTGTVRACPPLKPHPTKGTGYCRWWVDGQERTKQFGPWGSDECVRRYQQFQHAWAAGTTLLPDAAASVADLVLAWLDYCERTYRKRGRVTSEYHCNRAAMKHLNRLCGAEPAADFTGRKLRAVREAMIAETWSRKTINDHCARIVRAFGWASTESLVPVAVHQSLALVETLAAGRREEVAEAEPVEPVPTSAGLHPTKNRRAVLVAMIRVQLLTGMRPGELLGLTPADVDRSRDPWRYEAVEYNKMLHKNLKRVVFFGPQAREVLAPLLAECAPDAKVFRFPPWRKKADWTPVSHKIYRARIADACSAAGVPVWTPNQLRHNKATELMDAYESDAAVGAALGNSPEVARQVYAHRAGESVARRIAEATG
jgi:integrase